jgi:outer membrane biosynthesis protein TonB
MNNMMAAILAKRNAMNTTPKETSSPTPAPTPAPKATPPPAKEPAPTPVKQVPIPPKKEAPTPSSVSAASSGGKNSFRGNEAAVAAIKSRKLFYYGILIFLGSQASHSSSSGSLSPEMHALKEEILAEVRKELQSFKDEIISAINSR